MRHAFLTLAPALAAALFLSGCDDDDTVRGTEGTGQMSLAVTDAPVDQARAVVVQFTGVELKPARGQSQLFTFDTPRTIDLLALHGGDSALLLDSVDVPAGRYEWLRLSVNASNDGQLDSYIELDDGSQHELVVPSGAEAGLRLVSGFQVAQGGVSAFTVDFDLRKSVHEPRNPQETDYFLRPALRLVDNSQIGHLSGAVDATLITPECTPAVYVFEGADVVPDDVDGAQPEPLTTALVELQDDGQYRYTAAFLAAGSYTASFTCEAGLDSPDADEPIVFGESQNVNITQGATTTADFNAPAA